MDTSSHSASTRFRLWPRRRWQWIVAIVFSGLLTWVVATRLFPGGSLELPGGSVTPKVSMGGDYGVVLAADGSLWTWGGESRGWPTLGRGDTNRANFDPQTGRVGSDRDWVDVSAGQDHVLALKSDGSMWAWGAFYRGQLGNGAVTTNGGLLTENRPVRSAPGTNWVQVEAGSVCSFGIQRDGSLWAWGLNNFSQLGIGSWIDSSTPNRVGTSTNWVLVRQGGVSSAGIQSDGSLWIWGASPLAGNSSPQSATNLLVPTLFAPGTKWSDVAVSYNFWLGIRADGSLWVWGRDGVQFAGPDALDPTLPVRLGDDADWRSVSADPVSVLLRKKDGSWWRLSRKGSKAASTPRPLSLLPATATTGDATFGGVAVLGTDRRLWASGTELGNRPAKAQLAELTEQLLAYFGTKVDLQPRNARVVRSGVWAIRHRTDE